MLLSPQNQFQLYALAEKLTSPVPSNLLLPFARNKQMSSSPECAALNVSSCRSDQCLYQVNYSDGSFTVGDFVTETLSLGRSRSVSKNPRMRPRQRMPLHQRWYPRLRRRPALPHQSPPRSEPPRSPTVSSTAIQPLRLLHQ
ncbi:unnamed protein product [Linum trigynum]|uniref:Xylanase inhibitor N-terminal domain-containing protein n=1 Tax=Linum trigynum TaxID=586398 RepID=A0AAV2FPX9_9ROSI